MYIDKCFKRVFTLAAALIFLSGSMLFSENNEKDKSLVKKGAEVITIKGITRSWKDVEKIPLDQREGPRKMRPVLNFECPKKIVREGKVTDPAVQDSYGEVGSMMPNSTMNFAGMNYPANGSGWPPDPNGDVGLTYYVQTVNTSIGIYRKSDGSLVSAVTFNDFFAGSAVSGTPCDNNNIGDPIVLYDRYAQRWFILDFAWWADHSGGSYYSIAVSKTGDPTGDWWLYAVNADPVLMNDYPKCGIWHDGIYITANMFQFSGGFVEAKIWALKKPDIYNGTLVGQIVTDNSWYAWSILPSNAKGSTAPPATAPNYMYSYDADEWGVSPSDVLTVWKYDVDWNTPANTTWTGPATTPTAAFAMHTANIPQQGTATTLDDLGTRLMYSAIYRNFGTHESVYLCHLVDVSGIGAMRWYEVRISGGTSSIYQQGSYAPDSNHRWMGSVAADKYGNIAVGYSVSSAAMYPAIRYAGRLSTDPLNQLSQGEASLIEGTGSQTIASRWGDYSMMTIDPVDDETFWYTNEYYLETGYDWQTRIGSFKFSAAVSPPVTDFNSDGKTDLLLRYYSTGGWNQVWYMDGVTKTGSAAVPPISDPDWKIEGTGDFNSDGKTDILLRYYGTDGGWNQVWYMDGVTKTGSASLPRITDLNWKFEGTGDFNSDGKTDILLRYYGAGGGWNQVWYMDGVTRTGTASLPRIADLDWKFEGTGDFNSDGKTDILLRYYGAGGGWNQVWYMDGVTRTGTAGLPRIADLDWKFEGTGDFNSDGKTDILLRYYGAGGGWNQVWYMDGVTKTGSASLPRIADLNWEIVN